MRALLLLWTVLLAPAMAAEAPKTFAEQTQSLSAQPGFIELWRDAGKGRVLLSVKELDQPFLLVSSLPYALGSNDVGLDRAQAGGAKLVRFQKFGNRLFLLQENTRFVARSADADERNAVTESFAGAVLWSGDILAGDGGRYLVDFSTFLLSDQHGVVQRLEETKQGNYHVDEKRSAVLTGEAKAFPDNIELESMLTFAGPGTGEFVRQVAADPSSLTMRQHISMVRLPDNGYHPRRYHPFSGGIDTGYYDFATPLASSLDVRWQIRHRLEKGGKPIVYYLDRGAPEPVRSALLEGARWWTTAFEKAGFKDGFRVELMPEGADPADVRYNVISWVHRATRGWSYGNAVTDPRTGQIIRGSVTLGSQRVRQDILIAEALLAPYGKSSPAERHKLAEQMALARLRQLAAHEVGHTLGFAHNFAASRQGNGSVMDYPHPVLKLGVDGGIDLQDAYGVGVGPWDEYMVKYIYGDFGSGDAETTALARLRSDARSAGLQYVSDEDSRAPGASHPNGLLWDFGPDTLKTWDQLGVIRRRALDNFSVDVLPDDRQAGELEARLVPVYLLQRYQGEAVARLLGGGEYESTTSTDVRAGRSAVGVRTTPAPIQRAALTRLTDTLSAEYLALPGSVLDQLTPPATGFERNKEYLGTRMSAVFDALSAAESGAAQTAGFLFDAGRLNRLYWQHARDAGMPGAGEVIDAALARSWKRGAIPSALAGGEAVQLAANWVVLDALLQALDGGRLHTSVDADLRQQLRALVGWLKANPGKGTTAASRTQAADYVSRYLADPRSVKLRPLPSIPPGAPI